MKRLNKEYSYDLNPYFKMKYGTTNHKKPEVIYIVGNTYISPSFDSKNYMDDIEELKINLIDLIHNIILEYDTFSHKDYIFSLDICDNRIKKNKKTFLTFELYLKQKECKHLLEIDDLIIKIIESLTNDSFNILHSKEFHCFKTKKK